jgi:hypothetical protein
VIPKVLQLSPNDFGQLVEVYQAASQAKFSFAPRLYPKLQRKLLKAPTRISTLTAEANDYGKNQSNSSFTIKRKFIQIKTKLNFRNAGTFHKKI